MTTWSKSVAKIDHDEVMRVKQANALSVSWHHYSAQQWSVPSAFGNPAAPACPLVSSWVVPTQLPGANRERKVKGRGETSAGEMERCVCVRVCVFSK